MKIPSGWVEFLCRLANNHIFASEQDIGEVVTFACEAKFVEQVAASQQLTFYLCSAQHQRRALCFDDGIIYGATIVGNHFAIGCAELEGAIVFVIADVRTLLS